MVQWYKAHNEIQRLIKDPVLRRVIVLCFWTKRIIGIAYTEYHSVDPRTMTMMINHAVFYSVILGVQRNGPFYQQIVF